VAVASSSLDQPSLAKLARGMYGLDLSAVEAMADMVFGVADGGKICRRDTGAGFALRGTLYII